MDRSPREKWRPVRRVITAGWFPLLAVFLFSQTALLGPLLWSSGLPKGSDMGASLVAGYAARDDSWHQIWNDAHFPGTTKHVSRFTITELALTWLVEVTGDPALSMRLLVWSLDVLALVTMYLLAWRVTGSRVAGALAAIVYVFNRAALLRTGVPLAAGFALVPLLFLALDNLLGRPSLGRALAFGVVAALFVTSTIPGFTYIVAIALLVYSLAFFVARAFARGERLSLASEAARGGFLLLAVLIAVPLSGYYLAGLLLSTLPLVEETGGYDVEFISRNLLSYREAVALASRWLEVSTPGAEVAALALAGVAVAASLLRFHYRVAALLVIAAISIVFATNVTSPAYTFLVDHLPYFSLVRGPARWTGLALMAYSLLLAIGLAAAIQRLREGRRYWQARARALLRVGAPLTVAALVVVVAALNVGMQLPALRMWTTPYKVSADEMAPFERIAGGSPGMVFATTPFLMERIYGPPHLIAIDLGRTLGPAVSGHTAFGGFRAGGIEIRNNVWDLVKDMEVPAPLSLSRVPLGTQATPLGGPVTNFWLMARAAVQGSPGEDAVFQLRFHESENDPYYAFTMHLDSGRVELARWTNPPTVLASAFVRPATEYEIRVSLLGTEIEVWLNGEPVLKTSHAVLGSGRISALATGASVVLSQVELVPVRPTIRFVDSTFAKVMGLFNVQYFVTQPYTSQVERQRLEGLPGLLQVETWEQSALYENRYYQSGRVFYTPTYGIYLGDPEVVVPGVYHLDAVALGKVGLVGDADLPPDIRGQFLRGAAFVALDASVVHDLTAVMGGEGAVSERPPLLYLSDLSASGFRALARPYALPHSLVALEPVQLLPRVRNFVLEALLSAPEGSGHLPNTSLRFRVQNSANYYELGIDGATGRVSLSRQQGASRTTLGEAQVPELGPDARLRLVASDDLFQVYVDGSKVLEAQHRGISEAGPVVASAQEPGVLVSQVGVAADREPPQLRALLAQTGFHLPEVASRLPALGRDEFGLFPDTQGYSTRMRGLVPGTYRLLVGASGVDAPFAMASVHDGNSRLYPKFERLPEGVPLGAGRSGSVWFVSQPLELNGSTVDVFAGVHGPEAEVRAVVLVEVTGTPRDAALMDILLGQPGVPSAVAARQSATSYRGEVAPGGGGLLVFQEAFDEGWEARLDGQPLAHVPVFGALNGFWVPSRAGGAAVAELRVIYTPQRAYQWGLVASGLALAGVLGVLAWPRRHGVLLWLSQRRILRRLPGNVPPGG